MLSSVGSLPPPSEGRSRASSDAVPSHRPPAAPITIHINMNDLISPSKNVFTFSISGTVLILPRHRSHISGEHGSEDINPIILPRFCVLAADSETVSTIIRNESEGATVEVYYISGDIRDAQTRKTVLQRNGINRCSNDGARIALRPTSRTVVLQRSGDRGIDSSRLSPRHSPPNGYKTALSTLPLTPVHGGSMRRKRDGPLMIPSVNVIVTPLLLKGATYPDAHAVRAYMHAPSYPGSDWLEFGLAQVASPSGEEEWRYHVDIVSVSMDGVPVRFESSTFAERNEQPMIDLVPSYDEKARNRWITWVKVYGGDEGGLVTVDYVVRETRNPKHLKRYVKGKANFDILIPTFALPVGRLEVTVETCLEMVVLCSNFAHQQKSPDGYKLLHHSLDQFFTPTLSLANDRAGYRGWMGWLSLGKILLFFLGIFPAVLALMLVNNLGTEIKYMRRDLDRFDVRSSDHSIPTPSTETMFVTTTIYSPSPSATAEANNASNQIALTSFTSTETVPSTEQTPSSAVLHDSNRSQIDSTTFTSIPTPSSSPRLSENSLTIQIPALPFDWTKFQLDLPPAARETVDRVLEGLGMVWQIFRKAYHYPLDPP
ncbi:hypothetical protein JVU11DRAFT_742 [Chiua virens]|nr:hypothetical protein JVU11DRAFT_742 [Chiua virens]